jgi:hypothetical protein
VIVRAEARNVDDLGKLVVARVQAVDGITRTPTCPVVHLERRSDAAEQVQGWCCSRLGSRGERRGGRAGLSKSILY